MAKEFVKLFGLLLDSCYASISFLEFSKWKQAIGEGSFVKYFEVL